MIGYRDREQLGAHALELERGVVVVFDEAGIAWDPTPIQVNALTSMPLRAERFERIERADPVPEPAAPTPVAQADNASDVSIAAAPRRRRQGRSDD